jgi:hypothetical protein
MELVSQSTHVSCTHVNRGFVFAKAVTASKILVQNPYRLHVNVTSLAHGLYRLAKENQGTFQMIVIL